MCYSHDMYKELPHGEGGASREMSAENYEKISPTAWLTAYRRTFTDIPYSQEIFEILEEQRVSAGLPPIAEDLKRPETAPQYEARYKLIDRLLRENQAEQILEVAAGMSSRGIDLSNNQAIDYVELDLPGIAKQKNSLIKEILKDDNRTNLRVISGNALNLDDLRSATEHFLPTKQTAVVNEGLLRYLTFEEKTTVANNIHALLERLNGVWITSDISLPKKIQSAKYDQHVEKMMQMTGTTIDKNRFESVEQAQAFFEGLGFDVESHPFTEVRDELASPTNLHLSKEQVDDVIEPYVVFVMKART